MTNQEKYPWLFDNMLGIKEIIRFKDRIEYRYSGQLHNLEGTSDCTFQYIYQKSFRH